MIYISNLYHFTVKAMQQYIAQPITTPDGRLLGVEIQQRDKNELDNIEQKRSSLYDMLTAIGTKAEYFERNKLICSVSIADRDTAVLLTYDPVLRAVLARLPFIALQIASNIHQVLPELTRGTNPVWLDGVGGNVPFTQSCDVVILDEAFTRTEIEKDTFPLLIKNIRRFSDKVIIKASDASTRRTLHDTGVWGVIGMYKKISFSKVHTLM